jgi:hypothetical protein
MPETKGRPRSKTATVERREASVPRHGTRRASLARNHVALANATKTQVRCRRSAHPSSGMDANIEHTTRAQKRAAGTRRAVLCGIVNSRRAPLRGSHPNVSNRRRLPAAARLRACRMPGRATRLPAPAAIHQPARALYFSCYLQVRPLDCTLRARKGRALHSPGIRDPRSGRMLQDRATLALQHEERERPPMRVRTPRAGRTGDSDCRP